MHKYTAHSINMSFNLFLSVLNLNNYMI
ncbi:hypothetical protein COMA1_11672 [Candidatus Nitrospira nitrosa]|uniref:Uncharacterized protein n=1 Tax=Candidatus Nitrospira nitrosa TaxID=1742972 RepID=A0A0S4L9K5_9BACT|nr:hypothetical protein COMA1_11672 [Candidatus Nitrospira nitrosa]